MRSLVILLPGRYYTFLLAIRIIPLHVRFSRQSLTPYNYKYINFKHIYSVSRVKHDSDIKSWKNQCKIDNKYVIMRHDYVRSISPVMFQSLMCVYAHTMHFTILCGVYQSKRVKITAPQM